MFNGMAQMDRTVLWVEIFMVWTLFLVNVADGFNLDVANSHEYKINGTDFYFGYSLAFHKSDSGSRILVGAPRANEVGTPSLPRVGGLYSCNVSPQLLGGTCDRINAVDRGHDTNLEVVQGQWLGSTIAVRDDIQHGNQTETAVCAPRYSQRVWKNVSWAQEGWYRFTHGRCLILDNNLEFKKELNDLKDHMFYSYYQQAEYGFSSVFSHVLGGKFYAGAVATIGSGRVAYYHNGRLVLRAGDPPTRNDNYGYSITWANITGGATGEIVSGAPRSNNLKGKLVWFAATDFVSRRVLVPTPVLQTGAYFGAAVCAVDLNGDKMDDIIVGAPYYSRTSQEGRAYVFINDGQGGLDVDEVTLDPDSNENALFGSAIANIGDLNSDSYQDMAIGAPYGGRDGRGAVYIYHGGPSGIGNNHRPVQVIFASDVPGQPMTFGAAVTGGKDMDGDGNLDIAIGSYTSDRVHFIRSRPVIVPSISLSLNASSVAITASPTCSGADGKLYTCIGVVATFSYDGVNLPNTLDLTYVLELDKASTEKRAVGFDASNRAVANITTTLSLTKSSKRSESIVIYVTDSTKNFANSITVSGSLSYIPQAGGCQGLCPVLDMYAANSVETKISYFNGCGSDSRCDSDLVVAGTLLIPDGDTELIVGKVQGFSLSLNVTNKGENAIVPSMKIILSDDLSIRGVEINEAGSQFYERTFLSAGNQSIVVGLTKILESNKTISVFVRLGVLPSRPARRLYDFRVETTSASEEMNPGDNAIRLSVRGKGLTCLEISGSATPEKVFYDLAGVQNPPYASEKDIGPEVTFTFLVQNRGPSTVVSSGISIEIVDRFQQLSPLVYLLESEGEMQCDINVNPDKIELNTDLEANSTETGGRQRRDVAEIGCTGGNCHVISCSIGRIDVGKSRSMTIRARLWRKNFVELVDKEMEIVTNITLKIRPEENSVLEHKPNCHGNGYHKEVRFVAKGVRSQRAKQDKSIEWWVILVSVLGGIIVIAGAVLLLNKVGFFKRKRIKDISGPMGIENENENNYE